MKTGILVLNYNNCSDTINCVESIFAVNTSSIKIVIVDNGSRLNNMVRLKEYVCNQPLENMIIQPNESVDRLSQITLLLSDKNLGYQWEII